MGRSFYPIIPEGENHCVWMDAGLVSYKLCDKEFECDSCPFDGVMKTRHPGPGRRSVKAEAEHRAPAFHASASLVDEVIFQLLEPLRNTIFPDDRVYFANHLWLRRMSGGECQIGVDHCLSQLLRPLLGVVLINAPAGVEAHSPFAWLLREKHTLTLRSAVTGAVTAGNSALAARPSILTSDPYGRGWIVTVSPRPDAVDLPGSHSPDAFRELVPDLIARIEAFIGATFSKRPPELGPSLPGGGRPIETIEELIGRERYRQLLSAVLHPRP
jgi:glycine cleavage system H protein